MDYLLPKRLQSRSLQSMFVEHDHCIYSSLFQALAHLTNSLLLVFLRNDMIVMDKDIKAIMPLLLEMAKSKILRV